MTTLKPMASICSLANAISSASKAALAGGTRPTVSPGARRFGLMTLGRGAAAAMRGEVAATAAAVTERRAKSRRFSMGAIVGRPAGRTHPQMSQMYADKNPLDSDGWLLVHLV